MGQCDSIPLNMSCSALAVTQGSLKLVVYSAKVVILLCGR